jgi:NADH-quinone oxidoreductase subunit N
MMPVSYAAVLKALAPEAVLVATAFAALTWDLVGVRGAEPGRRNRVIGAVSIAGLLVSLLPLCLQVGNDALPTFEGTLAINALSAIFGLVIVLLTALTVLISMDFDVGRHVGEYYATMLFGATGMLLLVSTENLLMMFVALELTSLCLYVLTAFHKGALRSQEAAVKYFMFGAIASAFLLFGLSYVFGVTGTTNLREIARGAQVAGGGTLMIAALLFVIIGFGFKVAVVPFHLWAPDAYEGAPTPVTAFIATGSKAASFIVFAKLMLTGFEHMPGSAAWGGFASGWTMVLAVTAAASMLLGNVVAIVQRNVKRLLAYSSIAHAGYILVGLVAATATGSMAVLFYLIVYALTNLGAFGVVAALGSRAGGDDMEHFNGMARRAPFVSALMLVFVLSLAGIPPLAGFYGKFYLFAAAMEGDAPKFGLLWLVVLAIAMSAVSLYYYLILLKHIYVLPAKDDAPIEVPAFVKGALAVVALCVVWFGAFPQQLLELLNVLIDGL